MIGPRPVPRKSIAVLAAALVLGLLVLNFIQQRREVQAQQEGRAAIERLARADQNRITYPDDAKPTLALPGGRVRAVRSLIEVGKPLHFGDYVWDDSAATSGAVWIRIDLTRQLVSVFRGEDEIGTAVILYGAPEKPTPKGAFKVIAKATDHYSRSYDAPMPYMLRLTNDGIAIHASRVRPNGATHGCLGVPMRFAELLYRVAGEGTEVFILADPAPELGKTA